MDSENVPCPGGKLFCLHRLFLVLVVNEVFLLCIVTGSEKQHLSHHTGIAARETDQFLASSYVFWAQTRESVFQIPFIFLVGGDLFETCLQPG